MSESKGRLGDILVASGKLDPEQLEAGLERQRESGQPLGMTLVRMGVLDEQTLIRTLAVQLSLPLARLRGKRVVPEVVQLLPRDLAEKHHCFPLFVKEESEGTVLYLGMEDATNLDALEDVAERIEMKVRPVLVATSEIDEALARSYPSAAEPVAEAAAAEEGEAGEEPMGSEPEEPLVGEPGSGGSAADDEPSGVSMSDSDFELVTADGGLEVDITPPEPDPEVDAAASEIAIDVESSDPDIDPDADTGSAAAAQPPVGPETGIEEPAPPPVEPEPQGDAASEAAPEPAEQAYGPIEIRDDGPSEGSGAGVSQASILRALTQLLVEKGVITRDDLIDRVHRANAYPGSERRKA